MGERLRAFDWASHPLGPPQDWPDALGMAVALCLNSSFRTAIYWGPDFHVLYNDAWSEIPAEKHPWMLGRPAREAWADIWSIVGPQLQQVMDTGAGLAFYEEMLPMERQGRPKETWWNYSFTPVRDGRNRVGGVFNQGNEVSAIVHARRERQAELTRWHKVFQQAPAGVALLRGPDHVYEFANDAYLRVVGKTALVGKTVREGVPEVVEQGYVEVLDTVYAGKPFVGSSLPVRLQMVPGGPAEERLLDFVFQPVQDPTGAVDGIFILVTDVTDRARAESALRISNWQLGEERARLAATVEAEQRARTALRRMTETLEAQVGARTRQLSEALAAQGVAADRLRTTFETSLSYQGYMDKDGTLRDANARSLADIRCQLADVVGRPFWETPWFSATPGAPEVIRAAVAAAARGEAVRREMEVVLPGGRRRFDFALRPVRNAGGEIIGLVPEAVDIGPA